MLVLGLTCGFELFHQEFIPEFPIWFGHDAAAAIVNDGNVVVALEEERLNRIKHTNSFAAQSIKACLEYAGVTLEDIDRVAYFFEEEDNDKELGILYAEHPAVPLNSSRTLIAEYLRKIFNTEFDASKIRFVPHHTAHAYAAFFHSGFDEALVVILDGSGERESGSIYSARDGGLDLISSFPIS